MALGMGLYFASFLLSCLGGGVLPCAIGGSDSSELFILISNTPHVVVAIVAAVAFLKADSFRSAFFQRALLIGSLVLNAIYIACSLLLPAPGIAEALTLSILRGGFCGGYVLFWGLNFAALDKKASEEVAFSSLAVGAIGYMVGCAVLPFSIDFVLSFLLMLSVIPFLAAEFVIPVKKGQLRPEAHRNLVVFYAVRACFGVCIGTSLAFSGAIAYAPKASKLLCVVIIAMLFTVALYIRTHKPSNALVAFAPFVFSCLLIVPLCDIGNLQYLIGFVSPSIAWLSWMYLSIIQLSSFKLKVGMDEASLAFSEKAIVTGALAVSSLVSQLLIETMPSFLGPASIECIVIVAAVLAMGLSLYECFSTVEEKQTETVIANARKSSKKGHAIAVGSIAKRYGLSDREKEVFALLAVGRTRIQICKELHISEGTARTHCAHIYRKIGIHSKEELIDIMRREEDGMLVRPDESLRI